MRLCGKMKPFNDIKFENLCLLMALTLFLLINTISLLSSYSPVSAPNFIGNIDRSNNSFQSLFIKDNGSFQSNEGNKTFNLDFYFERNAIENVLTKETLENDLTLILKVKNRLFRYFPLGI